MIKHILVWFSDCPRANYYTYQPLERDSANFTWPCVVQILTAVGERSLSTVPLTFWMFWGLNGTIRLLAMLTTDSSAGPPDIIYFKFSSEK